MKLGKTVGLLSMFVLAGATGSLAQTWTGGGADDNWITAGNWGGTAPVPGAATTLIFDGTTRLVNTNDFAAGSQFLAIKTGATAGDFTFNGAQIQLGNGGGANTILNTRASDNNKTLVINNDVDINEGIATIIGDTSDTITLNGLITNPAKYIESQVYNIQNAALNLTNPNNSFNRGIGMINATLTTDDLKDSFLNSKIGAGSLIKLGNADGSGHFVYTGPATSTDRRIQVGGGHGNVAHDGGGSVANNGSGAITFDNAVFNRVEVGAVVERILKLRGTYDGLAGANVISGVIADNDTAAGGILNVIVEGSDWQFEGANTYTGDTTVNAGKALALADDGQLLFVIGANGVNNAVGGTGSVFFDGDFVFDLTGASTTEGDMWSVVDAANLSETFGATFSVAGFTDVGDDLWTKDNYQFDESTGALSVIPEPVALGLVAFAGGAFLFARRWLSM